MKNLLSVMTAGLATIALFVACGGSGASASGPFGEIPTLIGEFETLSAKNKQALREVSSENEMKSLVEEMKAAEEQLEVDLQAAIAGAKGKEVATEVDPELPLKVSRPMTVEDVSASIKAVKLTGELELTATAIGFDSYEPTDAFELDELVVVCCDSEGKPFAQDGLSKEMDSEPMPAGSKVPMETHIHIEAFNVGQMGALAKVVITKKGSELYKQAKEAEQALEDASKQ